MAVAGDKRGNGDEVELFDKPNEIAIESAAPDKPDNIYRDRHGFALLPQPTRFKDDPLVSSPQLTP
jgi:hypothetical protein